MKPSALKALVDQESQEPDFGPMAGGMSADAGGDVDEEDDEGEPEETGDPLERGNELLGQWGEQGEALKESAGEIIDSAHEIGGDLLLAKVPDEATEEVEEQYEGLPDDLKVTFAQRVAPLDAGDMTALATALVNDNDGDTEEPDVKLVSTFMRGVADHAKEDVDPDDFVQDEDEDEEDEDDEGGEGEGDGAGEGGDGAAAAGGQSSAAQKSPSGPLG